MLNNSVPVTIHAQHGDGLKLKRLSQTRQCYGAGHWEAILWYGTCFQKGSLSDLYTLRGVHYLSAVLLPAALALHVWATETLGKVGTIKLSQIKKLFAGSRK